MERPTITELLGDDFCKAVGSVAALRGDIRFTLISAGDQLLATRLGDQGLVRVLTDDQDIQKLCERLRALAGVRGVPSDAIEALDEFVSDYASDCDRAFEVAVGSWTYLGGVEERHFGLFAGQEAVDGDLQPQWHHLIQENLDSLVKRLEQAIKSLEKFVWGCRIAGAESMSKTNQGEQGGAGQPATRPESE